MTKENTFKFEQNLLSKIGFIIPHNNINISKDVNNYHYSPEDKTINIPEEKIINDGEIDNVETQKMNENNSYL